MHEADDRLSGDIILIEDLCFAYPPARKPLFKNLRLSIQSRSHTCFMGPAGAGKTTLGKLIKGLLSPDSGSVSIRLLNEEQGALVGYVGADPDENLVALTVEDDIIFGLENLQLSSSAMRDRLALALNWTGLNGMEKRLTRSLSGGERQKVALAAVLAMGAEVVILDEAFSMLDPVARMSLRECLKSLHKHRGTAIIEITNDVWDALESERIIYMENGNFCFDGSPSLFFLRKEEKGWLDSPWGLPRLMSEVRSRGVTDTHCGQTSSETTRVLLKKLINNM